MDLDQLNPQQREAVETVQGPLLILAGAGSGKTRVITFRVAHLIDDLGVRPESVLAVTFTNKAAGEMAERVQQLAGAHMLRKPWISTFHSFCVRVLRRDIEQLQVGGAGYRKDFVIYDEGDQQNVVKAAMRRLGLDTKQLTPSAVLGRISWAKNHMLDPQEVYLQSADPKTERIAHIYKIYEQELRKANALDFDDLLLETVRLLKAIPKAREYWSGRFDYVLVDEYQDTNRPQYELLKALATSHQNIAAVGDEDQSIYSWRGADIRNILDFEHDFPGARIIRLEQNYRSTPNILQAASAVVAHNIKRKGKTLWTERQGGGNVGYYEAPDGENEALFVADSLSKYLQEAAERGEKSRAAVLYRTNAQSRLFEEALRRYQVSYHVVGGFSFYERAEIKDLISYLKLVHNLDDSIALLRVINTPARGIGKATVEVLERLALETGLPLWGAMQRAIEGALLPPRAVTALRSFKEVIEGTRAMVAGTYLQWLGDSMDESLSDIEERSTPEIAAEEDLPLQLHPEELPTDSAADAHAGEEELTETSTEDWQAEELLQEVTDDGHPLFIVPAAALETLKKKTEKWNKRAHRYGLTKRELQVHSQIPPDSSNPQYFLVTTQAENPELNGWRFLGAIDHMGKTNVLHCLPGQKLPPEYEDAKPDCDHCRQKRRRHYTFIVQHQSGERKQVGSTCVAKFLGYEIRPGDTHLEEVLLDAFDVDGELKRVSDEAKRSLRKRRTEPQVAPEGHVYGSPMTHPLQMRAVHGRESIGEEFGEQEAVPQSQEEPVGDVASDTTDESSETTQRPATTAELLKFLFDRTGYIRQLEAEDTPESLARIENLHELVNAAMDSADRGETLEQFLDHAALVADTDDYDAQAQISLMTLHSAKGLEFPLVFLVGMEEGLLPHSRTFLNPDEVEEERRLCYVGMTRAMDRLVTTRARYRRRYGSDMPEASVGSRFLEEIPPRLLEDLGSPRGRAQAITGYESLHYNYEDEDQRTDSGEYRNGGAPSFAERNGGQGGRGQKYIGPTYNSIDNIAQFFASRGKKFTRPKVDIPEPTGSRGFRPGQRVRHPKYGIGIVYQREGEGEDAKITVKFNGFGLKKLVEKFAQLEKA